MRTSRFLVVAFLLSSGLFTACNSKPANDEAAVPPPTEATADSTIIEQPADEVSRPGTDGGTGDQTNTGSTTYVCPMQCEGSQSKQAGKCPKCGMDLEKAA
ncbi:heavy metal-binding domain-containing protein [Hymenobacter koreensis]|uniref:Heavy metal binding domain-containing protein n=1 Tax=Hymenobacter koreensis TaxID=1084523 RepID=A0ABP8IUD5_9BACT